MAQEHITTLERDSNTLGPALELWTQYRGGLELFIETSDGHTYLIPPDALILVLAEYLQAEKLKRLEVQDPLDCLREAIYGGLDAEKEQG
jgi:hypothetical protein